MTLFHTDLDNTIIYSYKHEIGMAKRCVEVYRGREISFITDTAYELLKKINERMIIVPTTTRSVEQYNRIDLGMGTPRYALVCNGGVLIAGGKEDSDWYEQSLEIVSESREMQKYGEELLARDKNRSMEVRNIQGLFTFTKSKKPLDSVNMLKNALDMDKVDVFSNGIKVYIVPRKLNKGAGVLRLKEKLKAEKIIAAGDSEFDISMLNCADTAIAPAELKGNAGINKSVIFTKGSRLYAEEMLDYINEYE